MAIVGDAGGLCATLIHLAVDHLPPVFSDLPVSISATKVRQLSEFQMFVLANFLRWNFGVGIAELTRMSKVLGYDDGGELAIRIPRRPDVSGLAPSHVLGGPEKTQRSRIVHPIKPELDVLLSRLDSPCLD